MVLSLLGVTRSRLMMNLFGSVWAHRETPKLFGEEQQMIKWPKINIYFCLPCLFALPFYLWALEYDSEPVCLAFYIFAFLTNVSVLLVLPCFPLLPSLACPCFFLSGLLTGKSRLCLLPYAPALICVGHSGILISFSLAHCTRVDWLCS